MDAARTIIAQTRKMVGTSTGSASCAWQTKSGWAASFTRRYPAVATALAYASQTLRIGFALPFVLVGIFYAYLATGGRWQLPIDPNFYHLLADAFLARQLHLNVQPHPVLLAATNPYDPTYAQYQAHDLSYYKGHYYLYFGPLPGVIHAFWAAATRKPLHTLFVQLIAAYFTIVGFYFALRAVIGKTPTRTHAVLALAFALSFGLSAPMLYLIGWSTGYHEPYLIATGCLLWTFWALTRGVTSASSASLRYWLIAGICLSLAIASRVTAVAYVTAFACVALWLLRRNVLVSLRTTVAAWCALAVPVLITVLLLALYNYARFESPFETGQIYSLTGMPQWYEYAVQPRSLLSLSVAPTSALVYLFAIPGLSNYYPYFAWTHSAIAAGDSGVLWPDIPSNVVAYAETPVMSVFLMTPIALGVLLLPLAMQRVGKREGLRILLCALLVSTVTAFILLASFRAITIRYYMDFLSSFALLGGASVLLCIPERKLRRI